MAHFEDKQEHDIYGGKVVIYKRGDIGSDNWWCRLKIDNVRGYIRRSCKTQNAAIAMRKATDDYENFKLRKQNNLSLDNYTVADYFEKWIANSTKTETRRKWIRGVFMRYINEYMGDKLLTELTHEYVKGYWKFRIGYWHKAENAQRIDYNDRRVGEATNSKHKARMRAKSLSSKNIAVNASRNTLRAEGSIVNEMLKDARDEGHLIRTLKLSIKDASTNKDFVAEGEGRRASFTNEEMRFIRTNLLSYKNVTGKYKAIKINKTHRQQRHMLYAFVMLASSCGARVGELKQLVWKDLSVQDVDNNKALEVRIRASTSKVRRGRHVICHSDNIIKIMDEWRSESDCDKDDDLIFYSAVSLAKGQQQVDLSLAFKKFLKSIKTDREDGLYRTDEGNARTLYSLRHYYATQRLDHGVSVYLVATNMGTGINQIQKHYGHTDTRRLAKELMAMKNTKDDNDTADVVRQLTEMVKSGNVDATFAAAALKHISEKSQ
jgi:integrase